MKQEQFLENISKIHELFNARESHYNSLSLGVHSQGEHREVLDTFLKELGIEKNPETYFAAAARISDKKFESLDAYLEKNGATREQRDSVFESSYNFVRRYYEKYQDQMLGEIKKGALLPDFYMSIFEHTHRIGKLYSDLFLLWNRKLLFETNRDLERKFHNDQDAINAFIAENDLLDLGHNGTTADRVYSLLINKGDGYKSCSYAEVFPNEVGKIVEAYDIFISELQGLEDHTFDRKQAYIEYFSAIKDAWRETDVDKLVSKWSQVDVAWMAIDTPLQPGHPIEYYEDKYRRAVSIEFDLRLVDPSLFSSKVSGDISYMYEGMYDEIGRENFQESYEFSKNNQKQVQLYIGAPVLAYGSFLCGAYSAQVVPNDDQVSKKYGKKIFAFPKYVLEAQRSAPKMKLDSAIISEEILSKYRDFLNAPDQNYYKIYDIETIGHEFGHTLWLTPGSEVKMGESGLVKNIEEFKATAGGLVAHFIKGDSDLDEDIVITHLMRSIKIMRYREVEDILPYYCECLIHLHIFFESGMISYEQGKIQLYYNQNTLNSLREMYTGVYTQQIFIYLSQMDAANFLFEYVVRERGVFLPKETAVREFVEDYYAQYKAIGNEVEK